ncbi:hypothetical protein [Streptomyces aureoverticillatus]|uniref:hypothetical protein n=1 Tax=Streptomyces aureoverticillatus TaxID=66871 RepID=UPI0013DBE1E7|nr:hypothetical protein [Streptomyces aureoverticillatus]QIB46922.1 hypothetical protein G3H79_31385 [Streptomyces aureoverticillatus]
MSSGQKTMTLFVTVILGLIFVILGLSASWPWWAWPTTAALLLVIATVTHRVLNRTPTLPSSPMLEFDPDFSTVPEPEQRVAYVALPSAAPDYDFSFSATVRWKVLEAPENAPAVNAAGLAVDAVLQRARALTSQQPPTRSAFVQHQLNGALGTMHEDATGRVMAMAQDVSLSLPEHDRERLSKLSDVRKDEDVWEHERNYERSKRAYLGNDVLKDTGSAVVWWLSRNDEEVEGTVDRIGLLARLSAAANNDTVAPPFEHLVPTPPYASDPTGDGQCQPTSDWDETSLLFDSTNGQEQGQDAADTDSLDSFLSWFGFSPDDPELELFAERLMNIARAHGKTDIVEEIRRRFGHSEPDGTDEDGTTNPPD